MQTREMTILIFAIKNMLISLLQQAALKIGHTYLNIRFPMRNDYRAENWGEDVQYSKSRHIISYKNKNQELFFLSYSPCHK